MVASVDTYLRFAEAVNRLDLTQTETAGLKELSQGFEEKGAESKVKGALEGGREAVQEWRGKQDDEGDQKQRQPDRARSRQGDQGSRSSSRGSDGNDRGRGSDDDDSDEGSGLMGRLVDRAKWSS